MKLLWLFRIASEKRCSGVRTKKERKTRIKGDSAAAERRNAQKLLKPWSHLGVHSGLRSITKKLYDNYEKICKFLVIVSLNLQLKHTCMVLRTCENISQIPSNIWINTQYSLKNILPQFWRVRVLRMSYNRSSCHSVTIVIVSRTCCHRLNITISQSWDHPVTIPRSSVSVFRLSCFRPKIVVAMFWDLPASPEIVQP